MKSGSLFLTVVLLLVLAIPLIASSDLGNTVVEFSAISIINSQEEVVIESDLYMTVNYEILAVKPAEIKQRWLPSKLYKKGIIKPSVKCDIQYIKGKSTIQRRIRSPA